MFGFGTTPKTGTAAIEEAIGEFEDIAARIEAGVEENKDRIIDNKLTIDALSAENDSLLAIAARGETVASKLRALVA